MPREAGSSAELLLGRPGEGVRLGETISTLLAQQPLGSLRTRGGFAYVTRTGTDQMQAVMAGSDRWPITTKRWLVGVHQAISEPSAIDALAQLPKSQVRLAVCG